MNLVRLGKEHMNIFRAILSIVAILVGSFVAVHPDTAQAAQLSSYTLTVPMVSPEITNVRQATYTVVSGDTLSKIAGRFNVDWRGLYCFNQHVIGADPNTITPGERLVIGVAKCHVNQDGTNTTTARTTSFDSGSPQQIAWSLLPSSNRAAEYACLSNIINKESGWNIHAYNAGSGAYGIPQALPGSKMGVAGADWANSAYVQLRWMIDFYIPAVYHTPCGAWAWWANHGWY